MASQLVYTSAAKLLDAGRSGFGTVARTKAISPLVVSAIERVSQFANLRGTDRARMIYVHRRIIAGNHRCHVLSRICDAGADYTGRTNHIAHHLILSPDEVAHAAAAGVTPADILRQFTWRDRWDDAARYFTPYEDVPVEGFSPLGRESARAAWTRLTGQPAHARLLAWEGAPRSGVLLVPRATEPLALLAEALGEFGNQAWCRTFTTALESTDEMSDLDWIISTPETFSEIQGRCGARTIFDLSQPDSLPVPPEPAPQPEETQPLASPPAPDSPAVETADPGVVQVPVVKLRTSPSGPTTRRPVTIPAAPAVKQLGAWLVAGGATVVILVILAVATWKTLRPKAIPPPPPPVARLTDSQQDAVRMLRDAGISAEDAEVIAKKSEDKARAWATFVSRFTYEISGAKRAFKPRQLPRPPSAKEPDGVPAWLTTLTTASNEIAAFLADPAAGQDLTVRLDALKRIHGQLRSVADDLAGGGHTPESCDWFDSMLVEAELDQLLRPAPAAKPGLDQVVAQLQQAIADGQFSQADWPARHKVLSGFVGKQFGFNLKQTAAFVESGAVPKDFEKAMKRPGSGLPGTGSNDPTPRPAAAPDLSKVKPREVILVSRGQLEQGVVVALLREVMKANVAAGADKLKLAPLAMALTPRNPDNERTDLLLSDDKAYYCRTKLKDDLAPRFYADGRISLCNPVVKMIEFKDGNHEALVVVNERTDEWVRADLGCKLTPAGDTAAVSGELAEWLQAVEILDPGGGPLEVLLTPEIPGLSIAQTAAEWQVTRKSRSQPTLVFSRSQADDLTKVLGEFAAIAKRAGGTSRNAKEEMKAERKEALGKLKQALCAALGGGLLSKDLELAEPGLITPQHLAKARRVLAEKYQVTGAAAPALGSSAAVDLQRIEEKIGEVQLDAELPKLGKKVAWAALAEETAAADWIEASIQAILRDTKPPEPVIPMAAELKKITHISVRTRAGRALFKATPR